MLRLSNSKAEMFMHSERCFWWRYIRKLSVKASSAALTWGGGVHSGLEFFFKLGSIDDAMNAFDASGLERMEREGSHFTPERLRMLLNAYAKEYAYDEKMWDIIEDPEYNALVPINDEIQWQGIFDLVVRNRGDGLIYLVDHKTTAKKVDGSFYADQFESSQQMTGYHWMGTQLYGDDFGGIIINAIQVSPKIDYRAKSIPISRTEHQIQDWLRNTYLIGTRIIRQRQETEELFAKGDPITNAWPHYNSYSESWCNW